MFITQLRLHNIRNLRHIEIEPGRGLNAVVGGNGSGKTSLMEAIFFLGRGRSFRTAHLSDMITTGEAQCWGFARAEDRVGIHELGVQYRRREGVSARVDGVGVLRLSELARVLPVLFLGGERTMLLSATPQDRREFLDWGLFHVEPNFLELWRRYTRALSQRNAALRAARPDAEVCLWDRELSETGATLSELREQHVARLGPELGQLLPGLANFPVEGLALRLDRGWNLDNEDLGEALIRDLPRDRQLGFTRSGPHRADWVMRIDDRAARQFCSAGQQKILVCALLLAQVKAVAGSGATPVLCLDDLPAELDADHRRLLTQQLCGYGAQLFVSATEVALLQDAVHGTQSRVFHVEHGALVGP